MISAPDFYIKVQVPYADSSNVAYVIYDFHGRNEHELSVRRGSKYYRFATQTWDDFDFYRLRIVERRGVVWHLVEDQTGQRGLVPQE